MLCKEIMTPNPMVCPETTTAESAAKLMKERDIGAVPVFDERSRKLSGIVTDRDLSLETIADGRDPKETKISDLMTKNPVTCRPDDDDQVAQAKMKEHQIRRIPVVDEYGVCMGIIAQGDIALKLHDSGKVHDTLRAISARRS